MPGGRRTTGKAIARKRLLDLTTVTERLYITIDDVDYDLVVRDTADVLTKHRVGEAIKELGEPSATADAIEAGDFVKAQEILDHIDKVQDVLVMLAVPTLPDEVLARLPMEHKNAIIAAFCRPASIQTPTAAQSPSSLPTGGNGSPDSSDSTGLETQPSG